MGMRRTPRIYSKRCCRRGGFTLPELAVSLAVMTVLMGSMAMAVFIATTAMGDGSSMATRVGEGAEALSSLVDELGTAEHLLERTATAIAFTVADRDGDDVEEVIRYEWSGTAGDPLARTYNYGDSKTILEDVHQFDLAYDVKTVTEEYPGPVVKSAEQVLASHDVGWLLDYVGIGPKDWLAQAFVPTLPDDALDWAVTRIAVYGRNADGSAGTLLVSAYRLGDDNTPTGDSLEDVEILSATLSDSASWIWAPFSTLTGLHPAQSLSIMFSGDLDHVARIIRDENGGVQCCRTYNSGSYWWCSTDKSIPFYLYGTYTTPGPVQTAVRDYVTATRISLQAGSSAGAYVTTTAQMLNRPEILTGLWETEFNVDPTLDHNGDGVDDWVSGDGTVFAAGGLVSGLWTPARFELDTSGPHDFTGLTTLSTRLRHIRAAGDPITIGANVDWTGGTCATISAQLSLESDSTQSLLLSDKIDSVTSSTLATLAGLPDGLIDLRLVIDAEADTVRLQVNGIHRGTFAYHTYTPSHDDRQVTIAVPAAKTAEFDFFSLRTGEAK